MMKKNLLFQFLLVAFLLPAFSCSDDDSTPEIDDLFRKIQRLGLKTLLLSNNDRGRVERFIKNIDTPYICDADKPNPQNYLKAVEMLNIKKEEAVPW